MNLTHKELGEMIYGTFFGDIEIFKKYYTKCSEFEKEIVEDILITSAFLNGCFVYELKKSNLLEDKLMNDVIEYFKDRKYIISNIGERHSDILDFGDYTDPADISLTYLYENIVYDQNINRK